MLGRGIVPRSFLFESRNRKPQEVLGESNTTAKNFPNNQIVKLAPPTTNIYKHQT
jgi:hypothetical protein